METFLIPLFLLYGVFNGQKVTGKPVMPSKGTLSQPSLPNPQIPTRQPPSSTSQSQASTSPTSPASPFPTPRWAYRTHQSTFHLPGQQTTTSLTFGRYANPV